MKRIILNFENKEEDFKEFVQEAFNRDILNFLLSKDTFSEFKDIERIKTFSRDSGLECDYIIYEDKEILVKNLEKNNLKRNIGFFKELRSKDDELEIKKLSNNPNIDFIIVSATDWKIIPFENLIADMHNKDTELIAQVENIEEAQLMLNTLEIGVDGVLIKPKNINDILELKKIIGSKLNIELIKAKVINIQEISESNRVCVDTTSILSEGEGMLIGSTAMGFVLVHAEVFETQFVASRPFRVNAGDVSAYVLVPNEGSDNIYRTEYLSELKGGKKVLVVNNKGEARIVSVGRVKIEIRPMLRFELEVEKEGKKIPINCICQNAETIRLIDSNGKAKSVVDIKIGDEILAHIGPGATHFGTAIRETIIEK